MPYVEPKGKIVSTSESDGVSRLVIEFDRDRSTVHFRELDIDIGPAWLIGDGSGDEQFQFLLHRVVGNEGLVYTFETFNRTHPIPKVGEVFSYRRSWVPDATDAALDTSEKWVKKKYPDNGDHDHCLFTWEHISSYDECDEGYFSEKYGWITCDSYEQFIEGDIYHLRDGNA